MRERILITAGLPYANGPIHFGHMIGAYMPGDCYARFQRLMGSEVLYICGSDEYGIAITLSAELSGRTPREQVDLFHEVNKKLFQRMNISFDHYSRTTCKEHKPIVQDFFTVLNKNGYIEEQVTKQLYSAEEGRFLADRYVMGKCPKCGAEEARGDECPKCGGNYEATDLINPVSKLTRSKLVLKETKHWYFRCDLLKDKLLHWLETRNWKPNVVNFVKPYIEELRPRAITRDLEWGVPIPLNGTDGKVLYVWFDAPIGYISGTQEWAHTTGQKDAWKKYWLDPQTKYVQFIGKDNIVFHAIFFPAMVMGQDQPYKLVDALPANEFFNLEGKKFSKSSGWYIDLAEFLDKYPVDCLRYALAANAPEHQDSEFTWHDFQMRVNSELVGKFGNFVHRTLTFIGSRMDAKVPERHGLDDAETDFLALIERKVQEAKECYNSYQLRKAASTIMELAAAGNAYFDAKKPWVLVKDKKFKEELETTMYCCLMAIRAMALVSYPIMPASADKIMHMLGLPSLATQNWDQINGEELAFGSALPHPHILFDKIEDETIQQEIAKLKSLSEEIPKTVLKEQVAYDDFAKLDLRVGKIEEAEKVPKSKRLLKLKVNLGFEKRTIVSGIAEHFEDPAVLINKKVIIVANLKPAKLMGIESEGMVLAATDGSFLELPHLKDAPEGTSVS